MKTLLVLGLVLPMYGLSAAVPSAQERAQTQAETRQLSLKWLKRDISDSYPFVTTGRFVRVQVEGYIGPLPSNYYYFRTEDDGQPIALSSSMGGVSLAIGAQFPAGITADFGTTWLPKLLKAYFVSDWAVMIDADVLKAMNEAATKGQLIPGSEAIYAKMAPPEFTMAGDTWTARFHTTEKIGGLQQHEFSGAVRPFTVKTHISNQILSYPARNDAVEKKRPPEKEP